MVGCHCYKYVVNILPDLCHKKLQGTGFMMWKKLFTRKLPQKRLQRLNGNLISYREPIKILSESLKRMKVTRNRKALPTSRKLVIFVSFEMLHRSERVGVVNFENTRELWVVTMNAGTELDDECKHNPIHVGLKIISSPFLRTSSVPQSSNSNELLHSTGINFVCMMV